MCCHDTEFGVAGSVDAAPTATAPVVRVLVTDELGQRADMSPDPYFNFFRHDVLQPPLHASAFGPDGGEISMQERAPNGACNSCHGSTAPLIHGP